MAKRTLLAALALPLWLAACASNPPASSLAAPAQFAQADPTVTPSAPQARWWGAFDDPQLDALVRDTFAHNRDLRMALERVERARALNRADNAALWPTGGASVTTTRARVPAVISPSSQARVEELVSAGVQAGWEIDLFGRLRHAARASNFESAASQADLAALRTVLLADVASSYFAWQGLHAQHAALADIVAGQRRQVELAHTRHALGATDELDLRRAQSELRISEARLATMQSDIAQQASRIAVLAGRFPAQLALSARAQPQPEVARPVALPAPQWMLERRPDLAAAEARLRAAVARSDAAWAELLPRLTLGGSIGLLASRGSDLGGDAARTWALQPALSLPLFDLLRLVPLREARQADVRIALAAYEKALLTAVADVEANAAEHRAATERVGLLAARRDDAERALQIAETRHAAGAIDQLALIDAQRGRRAAALELAEAVAAHRIAVVALYRALGAPTEAPAPQRQG